VSFPAAASDAPPAVGHRWLRVLLGALLVGLGMWMVANPFESVGVLALVLGASLVVGGVSQAVDPGAGRGPGWVAWLGGALLVVGGVVVLAWPDSTLLVLAVLSGAGVFAAGAVEAVDAIAHRDRSTWVPSLVVGGVSMVVGGLVIAWPDITLAVLSFCFGLRAIAAGLLAIASGWATPRLTPSVP
jgi:uncharacterized membrane protein HdeD (DUF308 family)